MGKDQQSNKNDTHTRAKARAEERKQAKEKFLAFLRKDSTVSLACEHIGYNRDTVYTWREKDENFAKEWDNAVERSRDIARQSIYQRAFYGWDELAISMKQVVYEYTPILDSKGNQTFDSQGRPRMNRGQPVMVRKYSDNLAIAWAKANLPEFKEKQPEININNVISTMAENAKNDLLKDLASAVDEDEDQKPTDQS